MTTLEPARTGRRTITIDEAAKRLGISRVTAYRAARLGQIPTITVGRLILVPEHRFEAMLRGDAL